MTAQVIPFQTSGPTRFRSRTPLTLNVIRGHWRPSGCVGGAGVFAVVWETARGTWWAALHDFNDDAQRWLIHACRQLDRPPLPEIARR